MAGGAPAGGPPQQVLLTSAAFDAYELPRDPEIQRRARLLDAALADAAPPGPLAAPGRPLTFYAFTRAPVGGGHPSAGRHPTYHLALIEQPLRLEAPPGPFTLPAALIPVQPLPSGSRPGFDAGGAWSWLEVQSGSAAYAFRPPLPARLRPEALVLTTRQVGPSAAVAQGRPAPLAPNAAPGPAEAGVFALYNWHTGAWDPLEGGLESVRVQPAAPYVGDGGQVRVRVTAAQDRLVRFVLPQLTVEGVVAE